MKLDNPSLPIAVSKEDAIEQAKETAFEKGWSEKEFQSGDFFLFYAPYFVFSYEAFEESVEEGGEKKVVSETESGRSAISAFDSELHEEVAGLLDEQELNLEKKTPKEYEFELQKARINAEEAKQIAQVKIAAGLSTGKENVIISGIELIYAPFWIGTVTIGEKEFRIEMNAVNSEMNGLEELQERGKSYSELTKETLSELKSPSAWAKYSFSIGVDSAKWLLGTPLVKYLVDQLVNNRRLQIAILFFILVLLFLNELGRL